MDSIGSRIKYARKMNNYSLTDVKNITGISTGNLSELENNKFAPSASTLIALRKAFHVSVDWVLTGESPMTLPNNYCLQEESLPYLNDEEIKLLEYYRKLDLNHKRDLQGFLHVSRNISAKESS